MSDLEQTGEVYKGNTGGGVFSLSYRGMGIPCGR